MACKAKHLDYNEIIVSKKELLYQLSESNSWDNLLQLLVYGRKHPDFEKLITLTSLKCEFLGSLVYSDGSAVRRKLPLKIYLHELFEAGYEDTEELIDHIKSMQQIKQDYFDISSETAYRLYRKFLFVVYTCVPCIADETEIWWAGTYRHFIEYAIDHDSFSYPQTESDSLRSIVEYVTPELLERKDKRCYVLDYMPDDLRINVTEKEGLTGLRN